MNCNVPTDIVFSLTGFQQRGGGTDEHADGWGIAFFEGKGYRVFLDPEPAAHSVVADFVRNYPIRSLNVIAHIRKATRGPVALENTHPFVRELWGRYWIFAHNGTLEGYRPAPGERYRPVGSTDSEAAFCRVAGQPVPSLPERGARSRCGQNRGRGLGRAALRARRLQLPAL